MRLLLTNDDGIDSLFLHAIADALRDAGHELYVAAPKHEQSWIGCAKSRRRPVAAARSARDFGCPAWSIDGTPSDCVSIALAHLLPRDIRIDAVVSGINIGRNASLGFILASGTLAGAWEGAVHGLPAIGFSLDLTVEVFAGFHENPAEPSPEIVANLARAAKRAALMTPALVAETRPGGFVVHNVNFPWPCATDAAVRRTIPARVIVPGLFGPAQDDGSHRFVFNFGTDVTPNGLPTDREAIETGFISHTVLDYTVLGTNRAAG